LLLADARYRLSLAGMRDAEAEDVVAEAWAVALPRMRRLGERDGRRTPVLLAFLSTTVRNVVGTLLRRRDVRGAHVPLDGGSDVKAAEPPDDATGAVTGAARAERRDLVGAALDRLDPIDREVLLLRGVEQRSAGEVAAHLGLSPSATSMRYRRALDRLRAELPDSVFADLAEE
jgi:RNA polymerase sigma-70 factor (ECF subfamily)